MIKPAWKVLTLFLLEGGWYNPLRWKMHFFGRLSMNKTEMKCRKNIFCFYQLFKFPNHFRDFFNQIGQINEKLKIGIISFLFKSIQKMHNMHLRKSGKIPRKNRRGEVRKCHMLKLSCVTQTNSLYEPEAESIFTQNQCYDWSCSENNWTCYQHFSLQ